MRTQLLIGPPGTGKTTRLLTEVEKAMKSGIPPERIAYCSFTRKASHEAMDRAVQRFGFDKKRFPYFRTLHSIAYQQLGLHKDEVMQTKHYQQLGDLLGLDFKGVYNEMMERPPLGGSLGDNCMQIYSLARAKQISLEEQWRLSDIDDLPLYLVKDFVRGLSHFKTNKFLLDFTDFMELCEDTLDVDLFILDEAQDLTRQQWQFAKRLGKTAKRVLIAGDDDQAIFQWSGADLDTLLRLQGERIVLPTSYRLPQSVFDVVQGIASKISRRFPKSWNPRDEKGEVLWQSDLDNIDVANEESWMLLARHVYQTAALEQFVRQAGVVYQHEGKWSNQEPYVRAIIVYEKLRRGAAVSHAEAQLVSEYVLGMKPPQQDKEYKFPDFNWPFQGTPDWMDALTMLAVDDREYVRSVLRRGGSLTAPGQVVLSTIHGAKGGEADNVVLLTDITNKTLEGSVADPDAEARVWYVGASRAKQRLYPISSHDNKYWMH